MASNNVRIHSQNGGRLVSSVSFTLYEVLVVNIYYVEGLCPTQQRTVITLHKTNNIIALLQLTAEHEHTLRILEITRDNQNALAAELADYKVIYIMLECES